MCLHDTLHAVFYVCWKFSYTSETLDPLTVHLTFLPCEGGQGGRFEKKHVQLAPSWLEHKRHVQIKYADIVIRSCQQGQADWHLRVECR